MRVLGYFLDSFATDVMFQPGNGDRANVPNYLVIITDGNSDNATTTWNEAMRARAQGINIITVSNSARFVVTCDIHTCMYSFAHSQLTSLVIAVAAFSDAFFYEATPAVYMQCAAMLSVCLSVRFSVTCDHMDPAPLHCVIRGFGSAR